MKKFITIAAIAFAASTAHAQDITGDWKSPEIDKKGNFFVLTLAPCGETLCGTVKEATADYAGIVGDTVVKDMVSVGNGKYQDGKIYAPDLEKWLNGKIAPKGNDLKVSGCAFKNSMCIGQTWTRN